MSVLFIQWLIFLHILSAIGFFLFHGASAAMAFQIRKETDAARIRALLDLSQSTFNGMLASFLVMGLTGIGLPFLVRAWDKGYIWASIVLILGVTVYMGIRSEKIYKPLRRLLGMPYMVGGRSFPAEAPASAEQVAAQLRKVNAAELAVMGYGIPAVVLWLMIFKPF